MISETKEFIPPEAILHDTLNQVSSILSIAQYRLLSKEVAPEVEIDLKRIVDMTKEIAANLKHLAEILEEAEDE